MRRVDQFIEDSKYKDMYFFEKIDSLKLNIQKQNEDLFNSINCMLSRDIYEIYHDWSESQNQTSWIPVTNDSVKKFIAYLEEKC